MTVRENHPISSVGIERQLSVAHHSNTYQKACWISMQRVWTNRNVDLKLFWGKMREFFEENDFETTIHQSEDIYHLVAEGSTEYVINGQVTVTLTGNPQDFSIVLELDRKGKYRKYSIPMTLAASFGFGLLLRDEFKSDEAFLNLRRDLWAFADRTAINLTGSAKISQSNSILNDK
jgi:hypothetical protein